MTSADACSLNEKITQIQCKARSDRQCEHEGIPRQPVAARGRLAAIRERPKAQRSLYPSVTAQGNGFKLNHKIQKY